MTKNKHINDVKNWKISKSEKAIPEFIEIRLDREIAIFLIQGKILVACSCTLV